MGRTAGTKNRNYPPVRLEEALAVPRAIQDGASGMAVSRLTLSELVGRSPSSSNFENLVMASRAYGLTTGGAKADQFDLTQLGREATESDQATRRSALQSAVMNVEPFGAFVRAYASKKVPSEAAFREFLVKNAEVPAERASDCIAHLTSDLREVGFIRQLKTGDYIETSGNGSSLDVSSSNGDEPTSEQDTSADALTETDSRRFEAVASNVETNGHGSSTAVSRKVFIAHGKNRSPLEQLKKMLDQFKVKHAVAIDEPNRGRPVSAKVGALMRDECSSAIFIFTADEKFLMEVEGGEPVVVWRPSENVVYELGAASILFDRRIVIFKERQVTFPSDFSDLGYIEFESDQLTAKMGDLFRELVALDILEVRAKA